MSRPYKKWTDEEIDNIMRLYIDKGIALNTIAKIYKVTSHALYSTIQRKRKKKSNRKKEGVY